MQVLKEIADTLDRILGDTDPHIEPDWTEEEIQREYPLFWSCRELYKYIKNPSTKFTAKIKGSEEEITGYYCPYFFNDDIKPQPAITVIEDQKIVTTYKIELETLRPAEDNS